MTHAGVLEFIADEGIVHLPAWMMKKLQLSEGDPIRLTGCTLPKGKHVKIQAQSTDFLQVSDAKAVWVAIPLPRIHLTPGSSPRSDSTRV